MVSTPPRPAAHLAGLDATLQRLEAVLEDDVLGHPDFHADQEIRIFGETHRAGFDLRIVDVVEFGDRERGEAVVGDVQEGVHPRPRLCDDEPAQRGEIVHARIARRDDGGRALELHQFVGGNADSRAVRIDVGMQVDQSRRHQLAPGIEHAQRPRRGDVGLDRLDHAEADADVALAAQRLARIEHVAALDHEVELVVRPHRCIGTARHGCDRGRAGQAEKMTA